MYPRTIRLLTLAVLCFLATLPLRADEIQWRSDYPAAVQEATQKSRPLLIEVCMENCHFCRMLEEQTFRDPAVITLVNSKYVPLRVRKESDPYGIVDRLQIGGFPTTVIAHPQRNVLDSKEGFMPAEKLQEMLQKHVDDALPPAPEFMERNLQSARQAFTAGQFSRAVWLIREVLDDGKERPVQLKAKQLLQEIEQQAGARLAKAKEFADKSQNTEAMDAATDIITTFAGTQAAVDAGKLLAGLKPTGPPAVADGGPGNLLNNPKVVSNQKPPAGSGEPSPKMVMPSSEGSGSKPTQGSSGGSSGSGSGTQVAVAPSDTQVKPPPSVPEPPRADPVAEARLQLARDAMAQARKDLAERRYQACLNRCEMIVWWCPDLPEAREAQKLAAEIKSSPELLSQACELAGEQLAAMLLNLAEVWIKRGQPQQAVLCLERVIKLCPGTHNAALAQLRLSEIQGPQSVEYKAPQ